jgi:DNA (cytosine-5)-methyltransferase 1
MRVGSVCSGIGAPECAWSDLGWHSAFVSEIEPFPRAVLAARFPDVPLHGDFTTIEAGQYEPIDLLVGGTPCQSFSVAGLRKGMADGRGNLALEYLRLADRLGPKWLVWENVPGVLSSTDGRDFGAFLGGVAELGYGFAYRVLDAQYIGVPQRRRRVFVVGYLGDWRRAAAVLFEPASMRGDSAPRREAREEAANPTAARAAISSGRGWWDDAEVGATLRAQDSVTKADTLIAHCLTSNSSGSGSRYDAESETFVTHTLRGEGFDASEDGTGRGIPLIAGTLCNNGKAAGSATQQDAENGHLIVGTLTSNGDAHSGLKDASGLVPVAFMATESFSSGNNIDIAPTMRVGSGLNERGEGPSIALGGQVRRLTPRECERLQGFPDDWTDVTYRKKPAADGPRYKALGNSMAVPVLRWIGERIQMQELRA